jgi:hypothetical protein
VQPSCAAEKLSACHTQCNVEIYRRLNSVHLLKSTRNKGSITINLNYIFITYTKLLL